MGWESTEREREREREVNQHSHINKNIKRDKGNMDDDRIGHRTQERKT